MHIAFFMLSMGAIDRRLNLSHEDISSGEPIERVCVVTWNIESLLD